MLFKHTSPLPVTLRGPLLAVESIPNSKTWPSRPPCHRPQPAYQGSWALLSTHPALPAFLPCALELATHLWECCSSLKAGLPRWCREVFMTLSQGSQLGGAPGALLASVLLPGQHYALVPASQPAVTPPCGCYVMKRLGSIALRPSSRLPPLQSLLRPSRQKAPSLPPMSPPVLRGCLMVCFVSRVFIVLLWHPPHFPSPELEAL